MSTVGTVKTNALRMVGPAEVNQVNFGDAELWTYMNEFLRRISYEIADSRFKIGVTCTTSGMTFASSEYNKALPSDFINEDRLFRSGTDIRLHKASDGQITRWEDDTSTGTPAWYYTLGTSLFINPRANTSTTVKLYYYPLKSITADTDTMPWGGIFDDACMWHVIRRMHERSEMFAFMQRDALNYERAVADAWSRARQRDNFNIGFKTGWNRMGGAGWKRPYYLGESDQI